MSHPEHELTFIAGGDMAASLPEWREPERVLDLARFAVAERDGAQRAEIEALTASLSGRERIEFFDTPPRASPPPRSAPARPPGARSGGSCPNSWPATSPSTASTEAR